MSNIGWQCPSCQACFAPHVDACKNCTGEIKVDPWPNPWVVEPYLVCNCTFNASPLGHYCPVHGWVSRTYYTTSGSSIEINEDEEFKDHFDITVSSTGNCFSPLDAKLTWGGEEIVGLDGVEDHFNANGYVPFRAPDWLIYDPEPENDGEES